MSSLSWLLAEAQRRSVKIPLQRTLIKYGLTEEAWLRILHKQGWKCPICLRSKVLWNTDHQHVPGYNKMSAKDKARHVRGILCWHCNRRHAPSNISSADARRLAAYLEAYESLRDKGGK